MTSIHYFQSHGLITDPGEHIDLFKDLPKDIHCLVELIGQFTLHYQHIQKSSDQDAILRMNEIYIRSMQDRLKKMKDLGITDFKKNDFFYKKTVCSCRDLAVILCSMLRHLGVAARVRYGFAQYLDSDPNFFFDHMIVEYWNSSTEKTKKWQLTERYLSEEIKHQFHIEFNPYDVPREKFITASQAWIGYRAGTLNPEVFGTGYLRRRAGAWYIRNKLIQDLAALNKMEMQPSDIWGLMSIKPLNTIAKEHLLLLDEIAYYLLDPDHHLNAIHRIYEQNALIRVEKEVFCTRMNGRQRLEAIR